MPTIDENLNWAKAEAWTDHGEEWSTGFGDSHFMWHGFIMPRIAAHLPCRKGLEIACGHGRCTRFLARQCERLWAIDLTDEVVNAFRSRLSHVTNIDYARNDGMTLPMVESDSIDFAFSWDSPVHAESDVLDSYARELARVLRPGGWAFLHHSNLGAFMRADGSTDVKNKHWRAESMTAAKFRESCARAGLVCTAQELIPWGGAEFIDCFSTVSKPVSNSTFSTPTAIQEHPRFLDEAGNLKRLRTIYGPAGRVTPA